MGSPDSYSTVLSLKKKLDRYQAWMQDDYNRNVDGVFERMEELPKDKNITLHAGERRGRIK